MVHRPLSDKDATAQLNSRFRRLLDVGALLDESIRLYREHWRMFVAVSALTLVPLGLLGLAVGLATAASFGQLSPRLRAAELPELLASSIALLVVFTLLSIATSMLWTTAVTHTTDAAMHDQPLSLKAAYGRAFSTLV